jgi:hypothetical protein
VLKIASNDADEDPFVIHVTGDATSPVTVSSVAYVKASNTQSDDYFGTSLAISGETMVIGAPFEDSTGNPADNGARNSGAAYVFVRSGEEWIQEAYLKPTGGGADDHFGATVAIAGDTLVIGAPYEDSAFMGGAGNPADNTRSNSGAVYVFVRAGGSWIQQAYLKASNTDAWDYFGSSVALAGGGDTLVVGAPYEDSSGTTVNANQLNDVATNSGSAYVFVRSGNSWSQQAYLKASNAAAWNYFGTAVAISGDTILIGAPYEDGPDPAAGGGAVWASGAAYVFTRTDLEWTEQAYLKAPNAGEEDAFGSAVAISGNTAVIGAPGEGSASTSINGDALNDNAPYAGAAYVFSRSGEEWEQQAYLKASNSGEGDVFGTSVAISGDAVLVGAPYEDSSATDVGGVQENDDSLDSGAAYLFVRIGGTWIRQAYLKAFDGDAGDEFGNPVAMAGPHLLVGAAWECSSATGIGGDQGDNGALSSGAAYLFGSAGASSADFITWGQEAGLSGPNAGPLATPYHDGVPNLLKYAFNMSGEDADVTRLIEGTGASGLPSIRVVGNILRVEFLRRVSSGLVYQPVKSSSLSSGSWTGLVAIPTVTVVSPGWERVVYEEIIPLGSLRGFGRVDVQVSE